MILGQYPATRLRRLRQTSWIRGLVCENTLTPNDLILPLFVREETASPLIPAMPGIQRYTIKEIVEVAQIAYDRGIPAIALFPFLPPELRSPDAAEALNPNNIMCRAIRALKTLNLPIGIITDVALDPYTTHGHDGIILNGIVDNDLTIEILQRQSQVQAEAGSDILAPSDMMDGRIGAIRAYLDAHHLQNSVLMSYAVKFASSYYGPFRQAVGVQKLEELSNKQTYQLNPANSEEALREIAQDIQEGADMIIVKPGQPYLDIVRQAKDRFDIPIFAYQVSGEYATIKAADQNGWIDGKGAMLESLIGFKRAGARGIFSYAALEMAELLNDS
jgi:porphobilinogen synthase